MSRFKVIYKQHLSGRIIRIIEDGKTGVLYLSFGGIGITPLLDVNGEVITNENNKSNKGKDDPNEKI